MTNTNQNNSNNEINKKYLISVSILTFVIPIVAFAIERNISQTYETFELLGKWFIFSAVGLRLFFAGIKQAADPTFTAKQIFHIDVTDSYPILRELGFANICFGLVGIVSLFKPDWRIVSAFASGLYYGIAGLQHLIKKPVSKNEQFALWTDLLIFILLLIYFVMKI